MRDLIINIELSGLALFVLPSKRFKPQDNLSFPIDLLLQAASPLVHFFFKQGVTGLLRTMQSEIQHSR